LRDEFIRELISLASRDPDLLLVTGDLGFGIFDEFVERFPNQFLNAGVAEQNMTGVAVGLALSGKKVFTYSIANFSTLRCLEQIRNDAAYHEVNVTVVASGGGFTYGALGMSHHATEDLAIMRALPGVTVVAPGTAWEAAKATRELYKENKVGYLRIEKGGDQAAPHVNAKFILGKSILIKDGADITFICTGGILEEARRAADKLALEGINARVLSMHTLKPLDSAAVLKAVRETGAIMTVEEHSLIGGLGSSVAQTIVSAGLSVRFGQIGLDDCYSSVVGDQQFLRSTYGMDVVAIMAKARDLLGLTSNPD
jgi:transketolase